MTKAPTTTKVVNRSSETGRFVTPGFAKTHPRTTETERVKVPAPSKRN